MARQPLPLLPIRDPNLRRCVNAAGTSHVLEKYWQRNHDAQISKLFQSSGTHLTHTGSYFVVPVVMLRTVVSHISVVRLAVWIIAEKLEVAQGLGFEVEAQVLKPDDLVVDGYPALCRDRAGEKFVIRVNFRLFHEANV
ncbi:uncharacterized protein LOC112341152 [Selaginella moellendorffii]|uniref:uncharacterized protein LOC112341152 n=1 Tax=Selaginella moellendorffii TaxID=88036 RepID=UPI000D1C5111|nr:uncharacterized protein LOC112341152 [Selaginella moellendorffii]|eukprot:XP_024516557.1 uncharacterized protein LOC112341152 [Selaginella moellendorffii]